VGEIPSNAPATITISLQLKNGVTDQVLPTNSGAATLTYKNFNNTDSEIFVDTPILLHPSSAIRLEYYLVNDEGEIINSAGTVLDSLNNRVVIKPADYLDQAGTLVSDPQPLVKNETYQIQGFNQVFEYDGHWYQWVPASTNHEGWDPETGIVANGSVTKFFGFKEIEEPIIETPDEFPLIFTKVKAEDLDTPLSGAQFNLYACTEEDSANHTHDDFDAAAIAAGTSCWEPVNTTPVTSDADGLVTFPDLDHNGDYLLREIKAPAGYSLPAGWWILTITGDADSHTVTNIAGAGPLLPPAVIPPLSGTNFSVPNYKQTVLPLAGSIPANWVSASITAALLLLVAAFLYGRSHKRQLVVQASSVGALKNQARLLVGLAVVMALLAALITGLSAVVPQAAFAAPTTGSITVHKFKVDDARQAGAANQGEQLDTDELPQEAAPLAGIRFKLQKIVIDPTPSSTDDVIYRYEGAAYVADAKVKAVTKVTGSDGTALFRKLPLGSYLITELPNKAVIQAAAPFAVSVPAALEPAAGMDALYDIHVYPKNTTVAETPETTDTKIPVKKPAKPKRKVKTVKKKISLKPKTGDELYLAGIVISVLSAGVLVILARRRRSVSDSSTVPTTHHTTRRGLRDGP
jgi:hypothetical protein